MTVAFEAFRSIYDAPEGRVPLPQPLETKVGDHQVFLTGEWEDAGRWVQFANSWGSDWGDQGLGHLSRDYLDRYLVEAWLARDASVRPSPLTYPRFVGATTDRERTRIWMRPKDPWRRYGRRAGQDCQLVAYDAVTLTDLRPVRVIELRIRYDLRVGWAHVSHLLGDDSRTSLLTELFVWPSFRRRGYGSILESAALENARAWGAERLQILLHEVDAQASVRTGNQRFGRRSGYRWRGHNGIRPRVEAVGEKAL